MFFFKKNKKTQNEPNDLTIFHPVEQLLEERELLAVKNVIGSLKIDHLHVDNSAKHLNLDLKEYDSINIITEYESKIKKYAHRPGSYIHYIALNGRLVVLILKNNEYILYIVN